MRQRDYKDVDRRTLLAAMAASVSFPLQRVLAQSSSREQPIGNAALARRLGISYSRLRGMLIGSLLGDALGGPIEFLSSERLPEDMPHVRRWDQAAKLTDQRKQSLARGLKLRSYETLRPDTAPFGPWRQRAPAGTITDDSRHKLVLLRAIRRRIDAAGGVPIRFDRAGYASEYLRPLRHIDPADPSVKDLDREGFGPYRDAARWWTTDEDRDEDRDATAENHSSEQPPAFPPERLWAGVANCSGQMALLPLAALFAGRPVESYQSTYAINFLDSDHAVDFCSAINAGLAEVLSVRHDASVPQRRLQAIDDAMLRTDPFRYSEIPFTGRPFSRWMQRSLEWAAAAEGDPKALFERLENQGEPHYWWDAHFTFLVPHALVHLCPDDPLAALNLCLDFGHDTDSYAQLLGAWLGAVYGSDVFPASMVSQVESRLAKDYGESIDDWSSTLLRAADLVRQQQLKFTRGTRHG